MLELMPDDWQAALAPFAESHEGRDNLRDLDTILERAPATYHPARENVFAAFHATPFDKVRVVIIGIAPYPNEPDATGVAFSTPIDRNMTKSVAMIYCAIATDLGGKIPIHGNLDHWTGQGVLLLNRCLTYHGNDHENREAMTKWLVFTKAVVKALLDSGRPIQFMLWGYDAYNIQWEIPPCRRYEAFHPAFRTDDTMNAFLTCYHFSKVNKALLKSFRKPIKWMPRCSWGFFETFTNKPPPPPEDPPND